MSVGWDITISNYQVFRSNQIRCVLGSFLLKDLMFLIYQVSRKTMYYRKEKKKFWIRSPSDLQKIVCRRQVEIAV